MAADTTARDITVLAERGTAVGGTIDGTSVSIDPAGIEDATGWHLEDRGLCRGDVCVPTAGRALTTEAGAIHLVQVAELLDRPIAADAATANGGAGRAAVPGGARH